MTNGPVLLVTSNFPPVLGGSGVVYANLARCANGRIIVVAPRRHYGDGLPLIGWREHDRGVNHRVVRIDLLRSRIQRHPYRFLSKLGFALAEIAIRLRLLAVLAHLGYTERPAAICVGELIANGWLLVLVSKLRLARVIVYVHGEEITTKDAFDIGRRESRRALMAADDIVVVSRFTFDAVRDLLGGAEDGRLRLIENGVDNGRFHPMPKRPDLVAGYGLADAFVFVSVCRLLEKKGIDRSIEAFARLIRDGDHCRFLVVGTGPYEGELRALVRTLGLGDHVVFAGQVESEDLAAHFALGDVFVMPNRELPDGDTEGFGLVFLEANACGLPVIAGRDGGSKDAVRDGVSGLLVDGRQVDEIERAMRRLIDDERLRARLIEGGRRMAQAADWRYKTEEFLQFASATIGEPVAA